MATTPSAAYAGDERDSEPGELLAHEAGRLLLVQREFRVGVQMPAPGCGPLLQQLLLHPPFAPLGTPSSLGRRLICAVPGKLARG